MDKEALKEKAKEFIKKCNVFPLVTANEGGVIHLEDLLVDFIKYIESEKKEG